MDIVQFSAGNRQVQPAPEMGLPSGAPPQEASIGRLFAILWRRHRDHDDHRKDQPAPPPQDREQPPDRRFLRGRA
jgi:hypothetical protein